MSSLSKQGLQIITMDINEYKSVTDCRLRAV